MKWIGVTISIHALRKESDDAKQDVIILGLISIHALRKESDTMLQTKRHPAAYFNPRSPRKESDPSRPRCRRTVRDFNPRSP